MDSNHTTHTEITSAPQPNSSLNENISVDGMPGRVTETIGTGENAKNSLIYLTLKWAFIVGGVFTLFVVINCWIFRENEVVPDIVRDIVALWKILIPIITLALGYAFGRAKS